MGTIVGNLLRWLGKLFASLTKSAKKLIPEIIQIVTNVKNFVDSPEADLLTMLIPGTLDNKIQDVLKVQLGRLLDLLNKSETIAKIEDDNERWKAIIKEVKFSSDDEKDIFYHTLASKLIQYVANLPWGKSAVIAEASYQEPKLLA